MLFYTLLFRLYHLTKVINTISVKQGEVSTFPVGTRRTHTNTTHSRDHYIQRMSRRRKPNVMHLPSLQPSCSSLLTSWYLSRPTIRRALIISTYYVNNQWYWLWPEGLLRSRVRVRDLCAKKAGATRSKQCFPPGRALRHPRRSDVTAALLNSWSVPSEPIVGTLRPCDRLCRSRLEMSFLVVISATAVAAWLPRCKGELEQ